MADLTGEYMLSLDPNTARRLVQLIGASAAFAPFWLATMAAVTQYVAARAQEAAPVGQSGGGGTLRRGIIGRPLSPFQGVVGVGYEVPYARRREFGFSGMTDALGRYYPNDPGSYYLRRGLQASLAFIAHTYASEARLAIQETWR